MLHCSIMHGPGVHNNLLFFLVSFSLCATLISTPIETENVGGETIIEEFVICRHCGSDITISNFFQDKLSPLAISSTNQTFYDTKKVLIQTLENPLGIRYKVAIANKAHCAIINSRWSSEYTWFPGYKWRVCLCPKCSQHLGWMFEPDDSESIDSLHLPSERGFYALITGDILSESYVNSLLMTEFYNSET